MNRAERGFTLFEVLVALAIAAVVLSAAVKLVGLYVGNSARIQERLYGHWAASNLLHAPEAMTIGSFSSTICCNGRPLSEKVALELF